VSRAFLLPPASSGGSVTGDSIAGVSLLVSGTGGPPAASGSGVATRTRRRSPDAVDPGARANRSEYSKTTPARAAAARRARPSGTHADPASTGRT